MIGYEIRSQVLGGKNMALRSPALTLLDRRFNMDSDLSSILAARLLRHMISQIARQQVQRGRLARHMNGQVARDQALVGGL